MCVQKDQNSKGGKMLHFIGQALLGLLAMLILLSGVISMWLILELFVGGPY